MLKECLRSFSSLLFPARWLIQMITDSLSFVRGKQYNIVIPNPHDECEFRCGHVQGRGGGGRGMACTHTTRVYRVNTAVVFWLLMQEGYTGLWIRVLSIGTTLKSFYEKSCCLFVLSHKVKIFLLNTFSRFFCDLNGSRDLTIRRSKPAFKLHIE